jgi:hypothetical protein
VVQFGGDASPGPTVIIPEPNNFMTPENSFGSADVFASRLGCTDAG